MHDGADVVGFAGEDLGVGVFEEVVLSVAADVEAQDGDVVVAVRPRVFVIEAQHVTQLVRHAAKLTRTDRRHTLNVSLAV